MLALNARHESETSPLDRAALRALVDGAFHVGLRGAGGRDGFLIALDEAGMSQSPNFLWFKARMDRFVYVDRIVVAPEARGLGHARRLYESLFAVAREAGQTRITCEVNIEPPNPGSDGFHAALGFLEVGQASLSGGAKRVRYLMREL